jgi:hypothetical protein
MSKLRSVSTGFWSDPFIEDLTPSEKLLFLYLITNEKTNMLGIYEASLKKISFETGLNKDVVLNGLKAFESIGKVKYVDNYVILVNYMKHQNFNTNMKKSAIDVYNNLPNQLKNKDIIVTKSNPSEGFESLLKHFGMVRKIEIEYEYEYEIETKKEITPTAEFFIDKDLNQAFLEWIDYRKEIRKTLKPSTAQKQVKFLQRFDSKDAILIIEQSIQNGWTGLFEIKNKQNGTKETRDQKYQQEFNKIINKDQRKSASDYRNE